MFVIAQYVKLSFSNCFKLSDFIQKLIQNIQAEKKSRKIKQLKNASVNSTKLCPTD